MQLVVTGLNHKTAPVKIREQLSFSGDQIHPALRRLDRQEIIREGVLLSTCNRTELYMIAGNSINEPVEAIAELCKIKDIPLDSVDPYLYEHEHLRAVEHCFEVAGSLNSMVVGETEILGQVKEAYKIAREGGFCDKYLHQLFQDSFRIAKQIRNQTSINRLPISVGSCAVALASQIFGTLDDKKALVIGGGDMSEQCLDHLVGDGIQTVRVANRTVEKAKKLASKYDGTGHGLNEIDVLLPETDIVITSTGSETPIIDKSIITQIEQGLSARPLFIIDIAVPRDVDEGVGSLQNVYLYDIDSLKQIGERNMSQRKQEIDHAKDIVTNGVEQYEEWIKTQDTAPLIKELKQEVYQLVEGELRQHLSPEEQSSYSKSDLQLAAHRITNKLLDDPVNVIKEKAIAEETDSLRTVREIFDLETGT